MPRRRTVDTFALDALLRGQERVVTRRDLLALGLAPATISNRTGLRGPWQRLLPGVVLTHRGIATRRERELGALAYVGDGAVITGAAALRAHGVDAVPTGRTVHILAPAARQRRSFGFVQIDRSRRMPDAQVVQGLPYAPVARALVDTCRHLEDLDRVRELVAEVIQRQLCSVADVVTEVRSAARQRTRLARHVVREMSAGVRSVAEAKAHAAFERHGVPQPDWNVDLVDQDGEFIGRPDGYWKVVAAAMEIDSMAWHLRPEAYRRTQRRQREFTSRGILVHPIAPQDIIDDEAGFISGIRAFLAEAARRTPPSGISVRRSTVA